MNFLHIRIKQVEYSVNIDAIDFVNFNPIEKTILILSNGSGQSFSFSREDDYKNTRKEILEKLNG